MQTTLQGKQKDELTLVIAGREVIIESGRLLQTMDTGCDAFNAVIPWEPGKDTNLDAITDPESFSDCAVYIGGDLRMSGVLYNVTNDLSQDGSRRELEIFTQTADIIDSTMVAPFEANNISLVERCRQLCQPFGIQVVLGDGVNQTTTRRVKTDIKREFIVDITPRYLFRNFSDLAQYYVLPKEKETYKYKITTEEFKFARVTAKQTDKIFSHLVKLAAQRGLLLSCTKFGDLLITKANLADKPVGTIEDGGALANSFAIKFEGRKRFNTYRALTSSAQRGVTASASIARDATIKKPRIITFNASDNLPGEAKNAAEWHKNKSVAESMTFPLPVNSWFAPNEKLWMPNTTVTIKSKYIGAPDGYTFLIRKVQFDYKNDGLPATLDLIPPFAYSLDTEGE